jgi:hypothetical protein
MCGYQCGPKSARNDLSFIQDGFDFSDPFSSGFCAGLGCAVLCLRVARDDARPGEGGLLRHFFPILEKKKASSFKIPFLPRIPPCVTFSSYGLPFFFSF